MISLLIAIGGSFVFLLMFFFCVPFYKPMKIVIIFIQINFVLIYFIIFSENKPLIPRFNNYYYSNSIYNDYNYITDYSSYPIKDFDIMKNDDNIKFKFHRSFEKYKNYKDNEYSKECLKNYFIKSDEECPITDLIVQKERNINLLNNLGYKEKKPFHNVYFYYTNNKSDGKLFTGINASKVNDENDADITIDGYNYKISFKTKLLYISNYTTNYTTNNTYSSENDDNLKKYLDFSIYIYIICFILLSISFMYSFCDPWNSKLYNYYKIINWIIYLINMILFIVRYIKIIEIKKLCGNLCNKSFLIYLKAEMMPLALSIAIILIYILYLITPITCHFNHEQFSDSSYNNKYIGLHPQNPQNGADLNKKNLNIFYLLYPLDIMFFVIFILVVINDNKIKENYKYQDFSFKDESESEIYIYLTTGFYKCSLSKSEKFNYNDMYNKNGKICGKDNQGFNLYFPENEECPINDVYYGFEGDEKQGYSKVYCPDHYLYLYYTNTNTEGKIIENLKGYSKPS